jgi:transposase-like protein
LSHSFCVCDTSPRAAFLAALRNPVFDKMSTKKKHQEQRTERAVKSGRAARPDEHRAGRGLLGFQTARPADPGHVRAAAHQKGQWRFEGFDQKIIALSAQGMTVREFQGFLLEHMVSRKGSARFGGK